MQRRINFILIAPILNAFIVLHSLYSINMIRFSCIATGTHFSGLSSFWNIYCKNWNSRVCLLFRSNWVRMHDSPSVAKSQGMAFSSSMCLDWKQDINCRTLVIKLHSTHSFYCVVWCSLRLAICTNSFVELPVAKWGRHICFYPISSGEVVHVPLRASTRYGVIT